LLNNQKNVETAIGKVDLAGIINSARDALTEADNLRTTARAAAGGPERYQALQRASQCFAHIKRDVPAIASNDGEPEPDPADNSPDLTDIPPEIEGNPPGPTPPGDSLTGQPADPAQPNGQANPNSATTPADPNATTKAVVVPNAIGKSAAAAQGVFGEDFVVDFGVDGLKASDSQDKLRVYNQNPHAGSTQFRTGIEKIRVMLYLSVDGKDPYNPTPGGQPGSSTTTTATDPAADKGLPVPSAIGMSVNEAYALISKDFVADFKLDDAQAMLPSANPAENSEIMRVISQSPVPFEVRPKGTKVMMVIRQLEKGVVPDVIGLSRRMAKERVAGSGLKPAFSFAEGFVEADDPGLDSMRVTAQTPSAGTRIQGEGEVAMVLIRPSTGSGSNDAGQPEPPTETTPSGPPTPPLDLGGKWTGELVITDVSKNLPEGCDASLLNQGKPFPMEMAVGKPNENGDGQLNVGGTYNGRKEQAPAMPFSYSPHDGAISFTQSQNGWNLTFQGRCIKTENGNVMEGTFQAKQGGQTMISGNWKQTKK
jgi:beta-lactam-binding protein with PASTA domain